MLAIHIFGNARLTHGPTDSQLEDISEEVYERIPYEDGC